MTLDEACKVCADNDIICIDKAAFKDDKKYDLQEIEYYKKVLNVLHRHKKILFRQNDLNLAALLDGLNEDEIVLLSQFWSGEYTLIRDKLERKEV